MKHPLRTRSMLTAAALGVLGLAGNASAVTLTGSWTAQPPGTTIATGSSADFTFHVAVSGIDATSATTISLTQQQRLGAQIFGQLNNPIQPLSAGCVVNAIAGIECTVPAGLVAGNGIDFSFRATTPSKYVAQWSIDVFDPVGGGLTSRSNEYAVTSGGPSNLAITSVQPSYAFPFGSRAAIAAPVKVTNTGTGPATDVTIDFPNATRVARVIGVTPGACTVSATKHTCNIGTVAPGASTIVTMSVEPVPLGGPGSVAVRPVSKGDGNPDADPAEDVAIEYGGSGTGGGSTTPIVPTLPKIVNRSIPAAVGKGIPIALTCDRACTATAKLSVTKAVAKKLGLPAKTPRVTIGSGATTRTTAGKLTVVVRLTKAAKARLAKSKSTVAVTVAVRFTSAAGTPVSLARSFKLTK